MELEEMPLDQAEAVPAVEIRPDHRLERRQRMAPVQDAIARLPAPLREVVTLFYVHDCSQQDVATFLGLPVTTVNTRLHAARAQLKRRMLTMVKETLEANQLPDDFASGSAGSCGRGSASSRLGSIRPRCPTC
jgi:DNA-directed RNA polymerase specialized sigma24 family protein